MKKAKLKNQIIFLKGCIVHKIIPKSMRIRSPISSQRGKNVTAKYRFELLLCAKNDAKARYFKTSNTVNDLLQELSQHLSTEHFNIVKTITCKSETSQFLHWKSHLKSKFEKLAESKQHKVSVRTSTLKPVTLNLCDNPVPDHHRELLDLGPKFVPVKPYIPYMDIISKTESTALKIKYETKNDTLPMKLRQNVLRDLKMSKPPKTNLTRNQQKALKELRSDNNICIYPYDKGAGLVRIEKSEAIKKIEAQIGNTEIITEDPTSSLARKFRNTLRNIYQEGKFTESEYRRLYPSDPIPPRMYGSVKAHKPDKEYPMRIVVSTIGTPSYETSDHLVKLIQPTLNKNETRLKNSLTFVEKSKSWRITPIEIQVSYDVVNLYPSVPVKEATDIMIHILSNDHDLKNRTKLSLNDIRTLIELCLSKCYFLWEDKIYLLKNSAPIGLALMVVMAEAFLQFHEKKAIEIAIQRNVVPKSFLRYVDDSHSRFENMEKAEMFQQILNDQDRNLQYTMEVENPDKSLNYLDLKITNFEGEYQFKIHRKNAITNVQVKSNSGHDPKILRGIFTGFLHRAYNVCSAQYLQEEIDFLIDNFVDNGYDRNKLLKIASDYRKNRDENQQSSIEINNKIVTLPWIPQLSPKLRKSFKEAGYRTVFKSSANLKTLLTSKNKSKLPKLDHPGVYMIDCNCRKKYVGETKLKIATRMEQHQKSITDKKWNSSGVSFHAKTCKQGFQWDNVSVLKIEDKNKKFDRKVREALEIQFQDTSPHSELGLNQDDGQYVTTNFWKPMLSHLKEKSLH